MISSCLSFVKTKAVPVNWGQPDDMSLHAEEDRHQCTQVITLKEKEKTEQACIRGKLKTDLELKRMQHQAQEADCQRAHEIHMLEMQHQMRFGIAQPPPPPAQPWDAPGPHHGGPAGGAPPPPFRFLNDNIHPDLR
ncbi:unnamed protein product [Cyclocybe aegerita]|uniref:Uncharacterized protein n=1 Tax=Cyclocybe aegerita TaxID=1973307 RepID=A0A8S0W5W5_CYCAE|nr:unnamed protein product [Cyclocybe aegerita]